jgi:hypothetical protein
MEAYAGKHEHLVALMDDVSYAVAAGATKGTYSASTLQNQLETASREYHTAVFQAKIEVGRLNGVLLWETRNLLRDH